MPRRNLALQAAPAAANPVRERRFAALRSYLRHAREALDLSFDQFGRALGVSGETIRRWETGAIAIPESQWAAVTLLDQEVRRLENLFEPDRLPMAVRRPADLFGGRMAIDWIMEGRAQEVADLYEAALLYQA
jgi:transcriptional regulator with XRE-family HTH domain